MGTSAPKKRRCASCVVKPFMKEFARRDRQHQKEVSELKAVIAEMKPLVEYAKKVIALTQAYEPEFVKHNSRTTTKHV